MICQVLGRPRSGSHLINLISYVYSKNVRTQLGEYFSTEDTPEEYERKFKFLETQKAENRHHIVKIQTGQIRDLSRVIYYLNDYSLIMTKRNPWDSYLSHMFQKLHGWVATHKDKHGNWVSSPWPDNTVKIYDIDEKNFILPVDEKSIKFYIEIYKRDLDIFKTIEASREMLNHQKTFTFDYDLEHTLQLKEIFPKYNANYIKLLINSQKINIDYEAHIPFGLVDHYKVIFDKYLNE